MDLDVEQPQPLTFAAWEVPYGRYVLPDGSVKHREVVLLKKEKSQT